MTNIANNIRTELQSWVKAESKLLESLKRGREKFMREYQQWYTRSLGVIQHLLPDRLQEFERMYHYGKRQEINSTTYGIQDYLLGFTPAWDGIDERSAAEIAKTKLTNQLFILRSALSRLDDILANIRGILQADLFDSEIDAARELGKRGHFRAAGALTGLVLEAHLAEICKNYKISIRKKDPTISDFNDALKAADIVDIPNWRWVQRLADLRNLCSHKKGREPTSDEVEELITGVDKAIKTLS